MGDKKDRGGTCSPGKKQRTKGRRREAGSTRGAQTRDGQGARERSRAGFLKDQDPGLFSSEKMDIGAWVLLNQQSFKTFLNHCQESPYFQSECLM